MSLRDELEPVVTGSKSKVITWLEKQSQEFQTEFNELTQDRTVGTIQLFKIAKKYGLPVQEGAFGDWRKKQWASKTN